jgi:hypothetical protein
MSPKCHVMSPECHAMSQNAMQCHKMPCNVTKCHAMSQNDMQCNQNAMQFQRNFNKFHAIPFNFKKGCELSSNIIYNVWQFHAIQCNFMQFHAIILPLTEYPSGSTTICTAHADIMRKFTGSDHLVPILQNRLFP